MAYIVNEDLWMMLLATVRYAIGRRSYVVGLVGDFVLRYGNYLNNSQLMQIIEEVEREIKLAELTGNLLGSDIDHQQWKKNIELWKEYKERREHGKHILE